ncbi:hypothetical protein [Kineococcus sp. NUM-3379]
MGVVTVWGWSIRTSMPQELLLGLYLRDAACLRPPVPHVPAADPPVPAHEGLPGVGPAAAQWSRWWAGALADGPGALTGVLPPTFPGLRGMPELRGLAELLLEDAVQWCAAQRERERRLVRRVPTALFEVGLVHDLEVSTGRRMPPVDLVLVHLPVRGRQCLRLPGGRHLVPLELRADRDAYLAWLRGRLEEAVLAARPGPLGETPGR